MKLLVLAAVCLAAGSVANAQGAVGGAPDLSRIVLTGSQVGPGYELRHIPNGDRVAGQVTLDMCGFEFPSEGLRTARLQVAYNRAGAPVHLSNEVVAYRAGGARLAIGELSGAVDHCPKGPVASNVKGLGVLRYRVARLPASGLLPGSLALRVHVVDSKNRSATQILVYQARGNVLSGVYTFGGSVSSQQQIGLHAAEHSALNLKRG